MRKPEQGEIEKGGWTIVKKGRKWFGKHASGQETARYEEHADAELACLAYHRGIMLAETRSHHVEVIQ